MRRTNARLWIAVSATLAAASFGCGESGLLAREYNGIRIDPPLPLPQVAWQRPDGSPYDLERETAGRVTLLYFGYTHCPDVCPMQLMNLGRAFRTFGADTTQHLRMLFVTLDPARDTTTVLTQWLRVYHPEFIALRGTVASVNHEVRRLGLAPRTLADSTNIEADPAHASAVVVFARDGKAHFIYPANTNPEAWEYDLRKLLRDSVP